MKKHFLLATLALALLVFAACGNNDYDDEFANLTGNIETPAGSPETDGIDGINEIEDAPTHPNLDGTMFEELRDYPAQTLQLSPLIPGEELAVLHTNHGDITLRFFPDEAPLAVESFITHARNGFYDGLIFHRIGPDFMIQGGCPQGTGGGGEAAWGGTFGLERSFNLHHFRGAVGTAHRGPGTIGSQFYIVQNTRLAGHYDELFEFFIEAQDEIAGDFSDGRHIYIRDVHPADALEHFKNYGGTPWLDWRWNTDGYGHTVFAHVVEGMDAVDSIALTPAQNERPIEDVIIERISFFRYGE
ncbi:MAG: peptidylprolyl isomerase [Defluviitaleaceae bacterium]|nr:peptidylprolyl isomerase [Defluviitaleaceae bacterium]